MSIFGQLFEVEYVTKYNTRNVKVLSYGGNIAHSEATKRKFHWQSQFWIALIIMSNIYKILPLSLNIFPLFLRWHYHVTFSI